MKHESPPVNEALILICKECGARVEDRDGNPAKALQRALKAEIKSIGAKKNMRAILTDCMDVCPKGRIVAAVVPVGEAAPVFYSLSEDDLRKSTGQILDKLLGR